MTSYKQHPKNKSNNGSCSEKENHDPQEPGSSCGKHHLRRSGRVSKRPLSSRNITSGSGPSNKNRCIVPTTVLEVDTTPLPAASSEAAPSTPTLTSSPSVVDVRDTNFLSSVLGKRGRSSDDEGETERDLPDERERAGRLPAFPWSIWANPLNRDAKRRFIQEARSIAEDEMTGRVLNMASYVGDGYNHAKVEQRDLWSERLEEFGRPRADASTARRIYLNRSLASVLRGEALYHQYFARWFNNIDHWLDLPDEERIYSTIPEIPDLSDFLGEDDSYSHQGVPIGSLSTPVPSISAQVTMSQVFPDVIDPSILEQQFPTPEMVERILCSERDVLDHSAKSDLEYQMADRIAEGHTVWRERLLREKARGKLRKHK